MGAGNVPWGEAFLAMLAMLIVLVFVLIYYCVMPVLTAMKRRKEQEEESWERDPRWNGDKFRYMPKLPDNFSTDKKYSRLAACSRSSSKILLLSSMRSENAPKPPNYSDLFDGSQMVNMPSSSPPSYTSKTPSVELSSSNETVNKVKEVREKVRFVKPKKNKKKIDEAKEGIIANEEVKADNVEEKEKKSDA